MNPVVAYDVPTWQPQFAPERMAQARSDLESGQVVLLSSLRFSLTPAEHRFLTPAWATPARKNVSYDPNTDALRAASAAGADADDLAAMVRRFARSAKTLVEGLLPGYAKTMRMGMTSYRPVEARGRSQSPRHDDTRLHVDAFPSRPTGGTRILRVFANVNPEGRARVWEIGEPFETMAARFAPRVRAPLPGEGWVLERLHLTKGRRTAYDHWMIGLHDRAKSDTAYQQSAPRTRVEFAAGSTWIVFTDRVMHAALEGQFAFEQTFYVPIAAMGERAKAPLAVLERTLDRALV